MGNISVQQGTTGGANKALSNLASVAINAALLPDGDGTQNIGSSSFAWANMFINNIVGPTVFNEAGADIDFRFEGLADINLLFLDASADNIGIGTSSPQAKLEVGGNPGTSVGGFPSGNLHVTGQSALVNANAVITGHNLFGGNKQLWYLGSGSSSNDDILLINRQNAALSLSTNDTVRLKLEAGGDVGIGVTDPDTKLEIFNAGNQLKLSFDAVDNTTFAVDTSGNLTITPSGTVITNNDFTKLGNDAPIIKMKKLTGTTGATEGDATNIAHGLTLSKIIGMQVLVTADNGNKITPGLVSTAEFEYDAFLDATNATIILSATNSGNMLSNAIDVLLTYEE